MNQGERGNLFLIDGHAVVYKYYYAYLKGPLINSKGEDTGAFYGLGQMLTKLLKYYPLTHIAVIFDSPTGYFRKDMYPAYKANRKSPDDVKPKIARAYEMCQNWGIYSSAFEKLEADDVIGAMATKASKEGFKTVIVTKDKDYAQLVNENTTLLDLGQRIGKDEAHYIDVAGIKEKFGVRPEQIVDYLALIGDTSDNVPGVSKVGAKTAVTLLEKYGTIDGIYENIDSLTAAQKKNFNNAKDTVGLWKTLVKMHTEVQLPMTWDDLKKPEGLPDRLHAFLSQVEFFSIINELTI